MGWVVGQGGLGWVGRSASYVEDELRIDACIGCHCIDHVLAAAGSIRIDIYLIE